MSFLIKYILPLIALGLLGFAVMHVAGQNATHTAPPAPTGEPPRNPYPDTVAGSGMIEPETENISIGSALPGVVTDVYVKVGQTVEAGQKLFRLDDRALNAELVARQAALGSAQAALFRLEKEPRANELDINRSQLEEAKANEANEADLLARARELMTRKVTTAENLVTRQQHYLMAKAQVARAQTQFDLQEAGVMWEQDKRVAAAVIEEAKAKVLQTRIELERLTVRALVPGRVLQVNVRPGEFVGAQAGQPLIVLGSVQNLYVRVDVDEYDIPRFRSGAPARATLRGQSEPVFPLTFVRIEPFVVPKRQLTGDNTERVDTRVLQVIYSVDDKTVAADHLFVGQQVDVFIDTSKPAADEAQLPKPRTAG